MGLWDSMIQNITHNRLQYYESFPVPMFNRIRLRYNFHHFSDTIVWRGIRFGICKNVLDELSHAYYDIQVELQKIDEATVLP